MRLNAGEYELTNAVDAKRRDYEASRVINDRARQDAEAAAAAAEKARQEADDEAWEASVRAEIAASERLAQAHAHYFPAQTPAQTQTAGGPHSADEENPGPP
jgi:hypothetical protein